MTRAEIYDAQRATVWLTGSLNGRGWEHVRPVGLAMARARARGAVLARPLRALQLGDDTAKGLGIRGRAVARSRSSRSRWPWLRSPRRLGRPDRVRRLRRAADRPPPRPLAADARAVRAARSRRAARVRPHRPARVRARPSSRSASSPASSGRRTCCGCSPGPTASAGEADMTDRPHHTLEAAHRDARLRPHRVVAADLSVAIPPGQDHVHRRRERLRQVDAAAGPRPAAQPARRRGAARRSRRSTGCRPRTSRRQLGILPQSPIAPDGITVADLVGRGRYPHQSWLRQWAADDEDAVTRSDGAHRHPRPGVAVASTSCRAASASGCGSPWRWRRARRSCCSTSRPRTSTSPTRSRCSTCWSTSTSASGRTIVLVLHDLNQAARYSHHLIAMKRGAVVASGHPADVISEELVARSSTCDAG